MNLVERLRDDRERRLFGESLMLRAADVIERLRLDIRRSAEEMGYEAVEIDEMLAGIESGDL